MARYLSRADLSRIAGKYIDQYYTCFGISKDDPSPINLEQFASSVLGLNVKMLPLCSDGSILALSCGSSSRKYLKRLRSCGMPAAERRVKTQIRTVLMPCFVVKCSVPTAAIV